MKRFFFAFLLSVGFLALAADYAVLVGIDSYRYLDALDAPVRDATQLQKFLMEMGYGTQFLSGRVGPDDILEELRVLSASCGPGDSLFVFFSGRGILTKEQPQWSLCTYHSDPGGQRYVVTQEQLGQILQTFPGNAMVFLDLYAPASVGVQQTPGSVSANPALSQAASVLVMTGTPSQGGQGGIVTYYLRQAFSGEADSDGNGKLSVVELARYFTERTHHQGGQILVIGASVPRVEYPENKPALVPEGLVAVEPGSFLAGNTRNDSEGDDDEQPLHTVTLDHGFWIGQTEVTNEQYVSFLNSRRVSRYGSYNGMELLDTTFGDSDLSFQDSHFAVPEPRADHPVMEVTWWGAVEYCNWLSEQADLPHAYDRDGNLLDALGNKTTDPAKVVGFRLPTEAEWEYAARGGQNATRNTRYAGSDNLDEVGWYWRNSGMVLLEGDDHERDWDVIMANGGDTHPVAQKKANELGLYDMSGNVFEWCHDWYGFYPTGAVRNPVGPSSGSSRVQRGGNWYYYARSCRVSFRFYGDPRSSSSGVGFRVVRTF
ncbi:MAG TPA: SUMF1/EgtB/PvdO family nonheme iron enzyme [Thermotogota bacterium]|nr:SUMF1/EgtB/PvdO family nonheme iron enzyme [Thermotogota bacterium]